ncbi:MAG TPA: alpha/beta hydrolase [Myxococcota bacterium]|nr:alpha/beta hydrolase [Myxococcota bacterium]
MPLDPQAKAFLAQFPPMPDFEAIPLPLLRQGFEQSALAPGEPERVAHVENLRLPGPDGEIPVRLYRPESKSALPGLVYFHGGGFVLCNLESHDGVCRSLANAAGCAVVSVDYRLAPEHPFPAAPEDCYAVTRFVAERGRELGIDTARIAVGGDSAGGNLTAVVSQMARDRRGPRLRLQLLVYPVTDASFDTPSYRENAEGYFLTTNMMKWFWSKYLADPADAANPYASPLRAKDLTGLPPGLCITAEFDPLRDEGEAYAARLREAGVDVATTRYDGMFHGFFGMGAMLDQAKKAVAQAAGALKKALA